ncbi:hypothetical protein Goshw_014784 [Gossypium schwendimanii]|uniref:Uncharacterized protein n=1 Tax=Gossypium schwendimanii TaxID=34291 RepID=A0A7J9NFH8_GOSSC|nr:hypothetical protein [Gossypium schwendimanii]
MHQSDRVLRQFGCRQPISVDPEYAYIPNREPIIVSELACVPEYMPWFRINGKPYLLSPEEKQRQLRIQIERRGLLNPRRNDDDAGPSTMPTNSPSTSSAPIESTGPAGVQTQSPGPAVQPMILTQPPFQMMPGWSQWPGSALFFVTPSGPSMYRPMEHEGSQEGLSESSHFYQSLPTYGFQTLSPFMMQTPPHTLFLEGGSSSQVRQPDVVPEEPESPPEEQQPSPEARQRRNPARNHRRSPCGIESPGHRH